MSYHVTYQITPHREGLEKEAVPDGQGAGDAVVILSVIYPPDGGLSLLVASHDGRTDTPLDDDEIFKLWVMLAHQLSESSTLGPGRRSLCAFVHEGVLLAGHDGLEARRSSGKPS